MEKGQLIADEEYEAFVLILINEKQSLNYKDVSATFVNYEVKRKDILFSSSGTSAESLTVRGRDFNRKGKGDHGRSKSRPRFRDIKKNQCTFCKESEHWKVDYLRIKDKNKDKESKTEINLIQVINTQSGSTSQAGG